MPQSRAPNAISTARGKNRVASLNKIILIGRLGNAPDFKRLPSGEAVASMSLATGERWTDKATGQAQERTDWHRITVWGKLAENCVKYLNKGSQAYVEGKIQSRKYTDKSGIERTVWEVRAQEVIFLNSSSMNGNSGGASGAPAYLPQNGDPAFQGLPDRQANADTQNQDDDIPF